MNGKRGGERRVAGRAGEKDEKKKAFPPFGETPADDLKEIVRFYGLRESFPREALEEAEKASRGKFTAKGRLDLRKKFIFTCDPATARDYDDALSLEKAPRGGCVLGVHIADVSHFVKPGGALDREAAKRSTSVYFPDRVLPMLPESLSNGACSLAPGEDRYAFSVFMTFDRDGRPVKRSFAKSTIRSSARFTYEQVMRVISGGDAPGIGLRARKTILAVNALARKLRAARFAQGALDIDMPEQRILLDSEGMMTGIENREYDESHQMVEECMVAANEAVAAELSGRSVKILARLHEPPDPEKIEELRARLAPLGLKPGDISKPKNLTRFLQSVKEHPLYREIALMTLQSMKRAIYDANGMGHYGLAKRFYSHFTSPIRRYPDLVLHRQLAALVQGGDPRLPAKTLDKCAKRATDAEERATEAERAFADLKKFRFAEDAASMRPAPVFAATVSRCSPAGLFAEIADLGLYGLVHISRLSRSYVDFDERKGELAARDGRRWKCGDAVKVTIARVDRELRRIDFALARSR